MLYIKACLVFAVCALGALAAAAAGDASDGAVAAGEHGIIHESLDASQLHNLTQHVVQARDDQPPPWNSKRTMVLGIGNNGQNIGKMPQEQPHDIYSIVKKAVGDLCPSGVTGMRTCDPDKVVTQDSIMIKDKNGFKRDFGSYTIKVGANYWGFPGAREVLIDAITRTISTVTLESCWKPDFNNDDSATELCKAPDQTMVRIDYVGWLVVFITANYKDMAYPHDMRVCYQEGWATGEVKDKVEKKIKEDMQTNKWHEPLKLKNANYLSVETSCFTGSVGPGQGDGWCRKDTFEYQPGTKC